MSNRSTRTHRPVVSAAAGSAPVIMMLLGLAATPAAANIDLELRPAIQTVFIGPGAEVDVGLYAVSDSAGDQLLSAIDAIIQWDPEYLKLLGNHGIGAVTLIASGFPLGDPFGLNEADPPQDGDGMYVAWAQLGTPVAATPAGTLITTFVFEPIKYNPATPVNILSTAGSPPGNSVVYDGTVPGLDVTGTLGGCLIEILPCCPPDFDYNCIVDVVDFLILLANWGTDPGGPPDLDGNGDVDVNDFLLLLAAWGPCP
ncbi:MAG: hypothetical protein ACYSU7_15615 [Planctomycetota bacterium]|jgi:hypothetical protein